MALTKGQKRYYFKHSASCPICHSDNISENAHQFEVTEIYRYWDCLGCGATWIETYKLIDVEADTPLEIFEGK